MASCAPAWCMRKPRSGSPQELRRQGLTPVYVGVEEKKSFDLELPFARAAGREDVLLFTQELSTLLNAGVPVDRALSITSELTERPAFRLIVQDVMRVLKSGKSLADSLGTKPDYFSELYVNMVRAGRGLRFSCRRIRTARGIRTYARRSAKLHYFVNGLSRRFCPSWARFGNLHVELRGAAICAGVSGIRI